MSFDYASLDFPLQSPGAPY